MTGEFLPLIVLLIWGTMAGLDLATGPQIMIARPLVAGTVGGALMGDSMSGLIVGAILELFALEILPVGAARYPDYGPAAVGGAAVAAGAPGVLGIGFGVSVALLLAIFGEFSIVLVRRRNSLSVRRREAMLDAGHAPTITAVHWQGIGRDALRASSLTAIGLAIAWASRHWLPAPISVRGAVALTSVVVGAGLSCTIGGILRLAGGVRGIPWLAVGLSAGLAWVTLS